MVAKKKTYFNESGLPLWAAPSRCYIWVGCHSSVDWISAFRRVPFSALSFFCCTLPSCSKSSTEKGRQNTHTLMIHRCISVYQPPNYRSQLGSSRQFSECVDEMDNWMESNRLKMNTDKTQLIWIGTRHQLSKVGINEIELQLDTSSFSTYVSDLGVILDN